MQIATFMGFFGNSFPEAGSALTAIRLVCVLIVWLGPETKGKPLPE